MGGGDLIVPGIEAGRVCGPSRLFKAKRYSGERTANAFAVSMLGLRAHQQKNVTRSRARRSISP